jgi:uncharacterized protein YoaH (UPF0181 family)
MGKFETFGEGEEIKVASQSIKTTVDIPCQECGCAYGWHEESLAAIERVRELLAELESTGEMVSPYLVAKQFSKALDGEQDEQPK